MSNKVNSICAPQLESLKSFSQLPSNSPEEDHDQSPDLSDIQQQFIPCMDKKAYWAERYDMAVFLLTNFNIHYMSWIKNEDHLPNYMERFSYLYNQVLMLPEFDHNDKLDNELKDWLIDQAISNCLKYRRQLVINLNSLTGPKTNKKLRIALLENANDSRAMATTKDATTNDLMTDDESDEGKDDDEDMFQETALLDLMTDDEDDHQQPDGIENRKMIKTSECGALGDEMEFISQPESENKDTADPVTGKEKANESSKMPDILLGEVYLFKGVSYVVTIPVSGIPFHKYLMTLQFKFFTLFFTGNNQYHLQGHLCKVGAD